MMNNKNIIALLDHITITSSTVTCHFKCSKTNENIISIVPFEPYDGKIEFEWKDILFHPIKSYNRYYHTPITIYGRDNHETIVVKAFKKVSNYFIWNHQENKYIYN